MMELIVYCGIVSLMAGIALGWCRMLWLLSNVATAGTAALAVHAWQLGLAGNGPEIISTEGLLFVEALGLTTLGWLFGRWRRDVEG